MSTLQGPPDDPSRLRRALGIVGVTLCVGVAAVFLVLMGAGQAGGLQPPESSSARTSTWLTTPSMASSEAPNAVPMAGGSRDHQPPWDLMQTAARSTP